MKSNTLAENNKGDKKMRFLRKITIICFALIANNQVQAQSNPGYLGRTSLVQVDFTGLMGNLIFEGPFVNINYGLSYEMARDQGFAWNFGFSHTSLTMDEWMIRGESLLLDDQNNNYNSPTTNSSLDYSFNEIKVTPRWYNSYKGGIAPFGTMNALELSLGFLNVSNIGNVKWTVPLSADNEAIVNGDNLPSVTVFSASYVFGGRRMITDQIGLDLTMGIGYTLYQSLDGNLTEYTEGDTYANTIQEFFQYTAVKHVSTSKLFQAKIGLSYLF
jgi:hypothetical protein